MAKLKFKTKMSKGKPKRIKGLSRVRKYQLGVQYQDVPEKPDAFDIATGAFSGAASLGSLGQSIAPLLSASTAAGPVGAAIGAGVGLTAGVIGGIKGARDIANKRRQAERINKYIEEQGQIPTEPIQTPLYEFQHGTAYIQPSDAPNRPKRIVEPPRRQPVHNAAAYTSPLNWMERQQYKKLPSQMEELEHLAKFTLPYTRLHGFIPEFPWRTGEEQRDKWDMLHSRIYKEPDVKFSNVPSFEEYKRGTSGIHIKPENRGKFTAFAKRKGMGVQEAARHVLANRNKYSSTIVKRANFARNAAKWKKEYGDASTGLENAELEKNELVFRKTPTGRYAMKADLTGAPTHEEGGQPFSTAEGDIIFPNTMKNRVLAAYNKGDYRTMDALRLRLPKTGMQQFGHGVQEVETNEFDKTTPERPLTIPFAEPTLGPVSPFAAEYRTPVKSSRYMGPFEQKAIKSTIKPGVYTEEAGESIEKALSAVTQAAPSIYDLARGIFPKVETAAPVANPFEQQYLETLRKRELDITGGIRDIEGSERLAARDIAERVSGAPAYLGARQALAIEAAKAKTDLRTKKSLAEQEYRTDYAKALAATGADKQNEMRQIIRERLGADAKKREHVAKALTGFSGLSFFKEKEANMMKRDKQLMEVIKDALPNTEIFMDANGYYQIRHVTTGKEVSNAELDARLKANQEELAALQKELAALKETK